MASMLTMETDWTKIFLNDLVVMGKSTVWLEANKPGARPARLPNARTVSRLADVCKGDADLCGIITARMISHFPVLIKTPLLITHIHRGSAA